MIPNNKVLIIFIFLLSLNTDEEMAHEFVATRDIWIVSRVDKEIIYILIYNRLVTNKVIPFLVPILMNMYYQDACYLQLV